MDVLGHGLRAATVAGVAESQEQQQTGPGDNPLGSRIRIGVSSCLLGEPVRFDGGHKRDSWLSDVFGRYVQWVPVCPEVEMGMPTPRETIRLEQRGGEVRLRAPTSDTDHTAAMQSYAERRVNELRHENLSGYVLKKNSPSCGVYRVRVHSETGEPEPSGRGMFAGALIEAFPHLPVEEEGRLLDEDLRDNFIERVFAYERLQRFLGSKWTIGDLVAFHSAHKLTLMAHSRAHYGRLGRLVANATKLDRAELAATYRQAFMGAMEVPATTNKHTDVLLHMHGYFSGDLDGDARHELIDLIEDYRKGRVPLRAPLTLLRRYVRLFGVDYLEGQIYLNPDPAEAILRNHV